MKKLLILTVGAMLFASCSVTLPVAATSNEIGSKVGTSSTFRFGPFFIGNNGDVSIHTAAKRGNIKKVSTVDFKQSVYFLIFQQYETIVTGE